MSDETLPVPPQPVALPGTLRFLLVEDNPVDLELVQRELRRAEFDFIAVAVQTPEDFTREVRAHCPHIVLADYNLPQWRGMEALEILGREKLDVPLILVSGALGEVNAVECLKQGATDYVLKGTLARLPVAIRRALSERDVREERRHAQEALAQKVEELARSNHELEQFAYVASHDLQEPLRKVTSFCQLLQQRYQDQLDDRGSQYIEFAVDGAKRMQGLINDLLAFSRVGRTTEHFALVDLGTCVAAAVRSLGTAIEESRATVTANPLPVVTGDNGLLISVFQNLIGNAIKFRSGAAPEVRIEAVRDDSSWLVSVTDNGIGIEPRFAERVFVIFQRLHSRETYAGTGIGLALCRKIIEFHGGTIWLDTDRFPGTRIWFTLPATRGEPTP